MNEQVQVILQENVQTRIGLYTLTEYAVDPCTWNARQQLTICQRTGDSWADVRVLAAIDEHEATASVVNRCGELARRYHKLWPDQFWRHTKITHIF